MMQRCFIAGCYAFVLMVVVATCRGDDAGKTREADAASPYSRLISQLSDPDPAVRTDARERLINQGEAPRPALRKALATADAQTHSEINRILLHIRWTGFGESDQVEKAFINYSEEDAETRCAQIDTCLVPLQTDGGTALLRILLADPSTAVRWEAAAALAPLLKQNDPLTRQAFDAASGVGLPRDAYLPADQNAPLLAIGGWSARFDEPDVAVAMMKKSMAIETEHPSAFRGQFDFAIEYLCSQATARKDYAQLGSLLREQAERTPWDPVGVPKPVVDLFAFQADFGPLPGLAGDLSTYEAYLGHPEMMYSVAHMLERSHHEASAAVCNTIALALGGTSAEGHCLTGDFLLKQGWIDIAERELLFSLSLSDGKLFYAYVALSDAAEQQDDDLAAAKYLERGLASVKNTGQMQLEEVENYRAQIERHYVRAYELQGDRAALRTHVDRFMQLNQTTQLLRQSPGVAADVIPGLQALGRNDQANQIFDEAYAAILAEVNSDPTDPEPKNNLAWLCACSGKKLDEAVKYSDEAVALVPDDAACLDTQADAYFRSGKIQRAIEIETHALAIKPGDMHMQRQLVRFRAGDK
jgi:tetratricopeptide (TPR) repeat protein